MWCSQIATHGSTILWEALEMLFLVHQRYSFSHQGFAGNLEWSLEAAAARKLQDEEESVGVIECRFPPS